MDFTTLKSELINIADDSSITTSNQERWLNRAYKDIQGRADWWWMLGTSSDTTVADQQTYSLPSDYRKMFEVRVDNKDYYFLPHERRNERVSPGWSGYYSILGSDLYLYPTPDTAGLTINYLYFKQPADMAAGSDEPTFDTQFHDAVLYLALTYYSEWDRELADAQYFKNQAEAIIVQMKEFYQKQSAQEIMRLRDVRESFNQSQNEGALSTP